MYNRNRPLGTSSRGLPSYGLTEPICNLTPHHRRRSDNADDWLQVTVHKGSRAVLTWTRVRFTKPTCAPRYRRRQRQLSPPARRAQPTPARVGRMLDRVYVGLSIPVPSSTAMIAASATRYQMNTVMLCLATNRSNQAIDA